MWVNGQKIADSEKTVGAWREYEFDITKLARIGEQNAIAVKVQPPTHPNDLAISYVDWNPGFPIARLASSERFHSSPAGLWPFVFLQ